MEVARAFIFLFLVNIALVVIALVDCLGRDEAPRRLPRALWAVIIIVAVLVGPVMWFLVGRPRARRAVPRPRPPAPDDDPDFLASLDRAQRREAEELLRRREEDPHRDRNRSAGDPPPPRPGGDGTPRDPARERDGHPPEEGPDTVG